MKIFITKEKFKIKVQDNDLFESVELKPGTIIKVLTEENTKNIKVKNPGILEIPEGKHFWDLPLSHYIDLAKKKGKKAVMDALLNLERWNKNDDPDISKKARSIIDKLKKNSDWNKI